MALNLCPEGRGWERWLAGCDVSWTVAFTLQPDTQGVNASNRLQVTAYDMHDVISCFVLSWITLFLSLS